MPIQQFRLVLASMIRQLFAFIQIESQLQNLYKRQPFCLLMGNCSSLFKTKKCHVLRAVSMVQTLQVLMVDTQIDTLLDYSKNNLNTINPSLLCKTFFMLKRSLNFYCQFIKKSVQINTEAHSNDVQYDMVTTFSICEACKIAINIPIVQLTEYIQSIYTIFVQNKCNSYLNTYQLALNIKNTFLSAIQISYKTIQSNRCQQNRLYDREKIDDAENCIKAFTFPLKNFDTIDERQKEQMQRMLKIVNNNQLIYIRQWKYYQDQSPLKKRNHNESNLLFLQQSYYQLKEIISHQAFTINAFKNIGQGQERKDCYSRYFYNQYSQEAQVHHYPSHHNAFQEYAPNIRNNNSATSLEREVARLTQN